MVIIKTNSKNPEKDVIQEAVRLLSLGYAVVFPTDTAYGIAVDATNPEAIKNLRHLKGRPRGKHFPVMMSSKTEIKKYCKITPAADLLLKKMLPGRLTLVLEALPVGRKKLGGMEALAVRIPNHSVSHALAKAYGKPLTVTSANRSYDKTPYNSDQILKQYKDKKQQPKLMLDIGTLPKVAPSTIVNVTSSDIIIERKGPVSKQQIIKAITS